MRGCCSMLITTTRGYGDSHITHSCCPVATLSTIWTNHKSSHVVSQKFERIRSDCFQIPVAEWALRSCFCFFVTFPVFKLSLLSAPSVMDFDFDFDLGLEAWASLPNHTALALSCFHCLHLHCFQLVLAFLWCSWRAAASRWKIVCHLDDTIWNWGIKTI